MESIDGLDFDETIIPEAMRILLPHYRRFAIADDVDRERVILDATTVDLQELVRAVNPLWPDINAFLQVAPAIEQSLTDSVAQAAMEAQIELNAREQDRSRGPQPVGRVPLAL